uniref:response regulator n=1 Tax=Arsenicicoccus bolidensis TaxID=229480 RepID=UPI0028A876BF
MTVRVLVVDDHPVVRAGLRALLAVDARVDVVGEAASGEEALVVARARRPDVVLMDLQMGEGLDGVAATRALRADPDGPRVLILTTYDTDRDVV